MKTKKIASLLLAGLLALSVAACGQQPVTNNDQGSSSEVSTSESQSSTSSDAEAGQTGEKPTEPTGQLVIGSITQVTNEFYDALYSNAGANFAMYDLIHGGDTTTYTKEGEFAYNDVVLASHEETENEDGSKTYTMTINDGLQWSDGSAITAKDYVFALLLENSDEMAGVDA